MKYSETLKIAKDNKINITMLVVANEVKEILNPSNFEDVCKFIYSCYIENTNVASISQLVKHYKQLLDDGYLCSEIFNIRYYNFRDGASYIHD